MQPLHIRSGILPDPRAAGRWDSRFLWIALDIILPAILAAVMLKNVRPTWIFLNLPIHYGLLILLAAPLSKIWGCSITRSLGWFEYIGSTFFWPFLLTVVQFVVLWVQKRGEK